MVFTQPARKARQLAVNMMTRTEWTKCRDYQFDPKNGRTDGRTWDNTHVDSKEWKKSMVWRATFHRPTGQPRGRGGGGESHRVSRHHPLSGRRKSHPPTRQRALFAETPPPFACVAWGREQRSPFMDMGESKLKCDIFVSPAGRVHFADNSGGWRQRPELKPQWAECVSVQSKLS